MVEKLFLVAFLKKQNWAYLISLIVLSFMQFGFIVCRVEGYRNILKLSCTPLATASYEAFLKSKKRSWTSLPVTFSAWFLKKTIYFTKFYQSCSYMYVIICWPSCDVINCEINIIFLIKPFFLHNQKVKTTA